ncbi:MAG: ATP-binding protein [Chloroflexi bacterium]|nr:ATP-binding protein [Chloroflexota bacterium]
MVVLQGARQTGKSTLAQIICREAHPSEYLTMDSLSVLAAAQTDPHSFLVGLRGKDVILDEIQRVPELFVSVKEEVDRERAPGRFLLTGSANAMLLPRLSDSLAGRLQLITLWPLAQCEIGGTRGDFIDVAFRAEFTTRRIPCDRRDVIHRALLGGYPEVVNKAHSGTPPDRLGDWFDAYVTTLLQRDVRDLANIQGLSEFPLLLRLIASRATAALNVADLSRSSGIANVTLHRYLTLLRTIFLIQLIQPWSGNLGSRLVKSPKVLMTDTGVLSYLNGLSEEQMLASPAFSGPLVENFVGMELLKLASWSQQRPQLFYYRTHDRKEVDFVLQARSGKLVGVEVKASATVDGADFKGLQSFAEAVGQPFVCGILLYSGETLLPFGNNLYAVPISALWES